ncbi:MAG: hypothetical protein R3F61_06585 [Myxococcota bacterium]
MKALFAVSLFSLSLFAGCSGGEAPSTPGPTPDATARTDEGPPVKRAGVVLETTSTDTYTFARMDACGQEAWVAGPVASFEVGQTVDMTGGMGMKEFHSDSLDRTFDKILFVDRWEVSATPVECKEAPKIDPDKPTQEFRIGTVMEVMDAGGYTYARLDVCGEDVWVAAPITSVAVGSYGATPLGTEMKGFESTSMERTFDSVWFVSWIKKSPQLPPC